MSATISCAPMASACTVVAALLTSFYSWRLIYKTFHGKPHDHHHYEEAHESPWVMLVPLIALAAGSILAGWPFKEYFAGHHVQEFFRQSLADPAVTILEDMHHVPLLVWATPTIMMAIGWAVAYLFYIRDPRIPVRLAEQHQLLYRFLLNKWYFDELYDFIFVRPAKWLGTPCGNAATAG